MAIRSSRNLMLIFASFFVLIVVGFITSRGVYAQDLDEMLIEREQEKWALFEQGDFETVGAFYAEDFINVGLSPMGAVRQNREEAFAMLAAVPAMPGDIILSDFLVVRVSDQSAVVSYQVTAPFGNLYASSVWVERDGEWVTAFYQATSLGASVMPVQVPFFGRYLAAKAGGGSDALLLNADGSYAVDASATNEYGTTGRFEINGDTITFTDDVRTDVPACSGTQRSGSYTYSFSGSSLILTSVDDRCAGRLAYFADRQWQK